MKNFYRISFLFGTFFGFFGIVLGAFGAHALKSNLSVEMLNVFETGVRYQMYHSVALIAVALLYQHHPSRHCVRAIWFFIFGIVLFSGSLYTLALSEIHFLGMITPFGGLCFLLGWLFLFLSALQIKKEN